jgi:hypothetical protein
MPEYETQFFYPNNTFQKFGVSKSVARVHNMNKEKQEELL